MTKAGRWTMWTLMTVCAVTYLAITDWPITQNLSAGLWFLVGVIKLIVGFVMGYFVACVPTGIVNFMTSPKVPAAGHDQSRAALEGSIGSPWDAS